MALTGAYTPTCTTCRSGGMAKLHLIDQADITSMTLGSGVSTYATITLGSGKTWKTFDFEEDTAHWNETVEIERGMAKYTEEIEIFAPGLSTTLRDYLEDMVESSTCGLVGIVEDGCGTKWSIGYTERFGKTRPLKVVSIAKTTAKEFNDPTAGATITLRCTSSEMAHAVTAAIVTA